MSLRKNKLLIISGFDPSGSAGLLKDYSTAIDLGVYPYSIVSSYTKQNIKKTFSVNYRDNKEIIEEMSVLDNIYIIKIGICKPTLLKLIKEKYKEILIVWNPVLNATSGLEFLNIKEVKENITCADFVVCNNEEEQIIGSYTNMIVTHGHAEGKDFPIKYKGKEIIRVERFDKKFRGTGCAFTSAYSSYMLLKYTPEKAIISAANYLTEKLRSLVSN